MIGVRLLETTAALALLSGTVSAAHDQVASASAALAEAKLQMAALTVARNLIETDMALPCATSPPCPPPFRCSLARSSLGTAEGGGLLIRLRARVTRPNDPKGPGTTLTAMVRRVAVCGDATKQP